MLSLQQAGVQVTEEAVVAHAAAAAAVTEVVLH